MQGAFALALLAGQVALSTRGPSASRLAVHLVDEGFDLVPAGTASPCSLTVDTSSETLSLEVRGARTVRYAIDARPRAVAELELLHRAVLALRDAGTSTTPADALPLASIREPGKLDTDLRGKVILATLEAGYGFTRTATAADASICVESAGGVKVGAATPDGPCTPTLVGLRADAIRALLDALAPPPAAPEAPPVAAAAAALAVDAGDADPWRFALRAAGGGTARAAAIDPLLSVGAAAALGEFGGRADAVVAFASRGEVSALEIIAVAGPTWGRRFLPWLELEIGLRAGAHLHRYDVDGSPPGTHADFTADLPVALALALDPVALELEVAPGLSSRARRHERNEDVLWSRGAARVLVTLGASFSIGGNRAPARE